MGGVTGGVFGATIVRGLIDDITPAGWLWICVGLGLLILLAAAAAGQLVDTQTAAADSAGQAAPVSSQIADTTTGNPALEGARLVWRSPYLLSIAGIVGLYEIVSTVLDFQFTSTIAHYLDGPAIGAQFSTVFAITNVVSMGVQLFLTSVIMTRLGVGAALFILPLTSLGGSVGFMAVPALWVGSLLNTADNGFSYSINQSAKEALYVPTSPDEKYKAKAFIDMFVQRFAKALAVVVSLGITALFKDFSSLRWLSVFVLLMIGVWIVAVRYAGKHFRSMTDPA
jgi:AAA family ATP:ADP antiporter